MAHAAAALLGCSSDDTAAGAARDGGSPDGTTSGGAGGATGGAGGGGASTPGGGGSGTAGGGGGGAGTGGATPFDGGAGEGGATDADAGPDAAADAAVSSVCPLADFVPSTCDDASTCGAGEECFRGVCLRTCGAALDGLRASLGPAVEPVAALCDARTPLYVSRARRDGACTRVDVFGFRVSGTGTDDVNWVLRSFEVDPFLDTTPRATVGSGTFTSPGGNPFFQRGPVLSPTGTELGLLLTYNGTDPNPVVLSLSSPAPGLGSTLPDAPGAFDWLDGARFIVAQTPVTGARFVVIDPASSAAPVPVLVGFTGVASAVRVLPFAGLVLAADSNDDLYVVALDRVLAAADAATGDGGPADAGAATPIDVSTDPAVQKLGGTSFGSFKTVGETHLLVGAGNFGDPLEAHRITVGGTTITLGSPERLLENEQAFDGVIPLTGDLVYLPHFERGLIAQWANP